MLSVKCESETDVRILSQYLNALNVKWIDGKRCSEVEEVLSEIAESESKYPVFIKISNPTYVYWNEDDDENGVEIDLNSFMCNIETSEIKHNKIELYNFISPRRSFSFENEDEFLKIFDGKLYTISDYKGNYICFIMEGDLQNIWRKGFIMLDEDYIKKYLGGKAPNVIIEQFLITDYKNLMNVYSYRTEVKFEPPLKKYYEINNMIYELTATQEETLNKLFSVQKRNMNSKINHKAQLWIIEYGKLIGCVSHHEQLR